MFEQLKELAIDAVVLVGTWFFVTFCGMMDTHHGIISCGSAPKAQIQATQGP